MMKPTFKGSLMFPGRFVAAEDLKGRDVVVTIDRVQKEKLKTNDGTNDDKWLLYFQKAKKPLVLNTTNAKMIAAVTGEQDATKWGGRRITLYPTTCNAFGQTTTCIRVRDRSPDNGNIETSDGFDDEIDDTDAPPPSSDDDGFAEEMGTLMDGVETN